MSGAYPPVYQASTINITGGTQYIVFRTKYAVSTSGNTWFLGPAWVVITMVWCGMAWYGMIWCGMVWYGMVWYGMVWYGMVWYGMVWYGICLLYTSPSPRDQA